MEPGHPNPNPNPDPDPGPNPNPNPKQEFGDDDGLGVNDFFPQGGA